MVEHSLSMRGARGSIPRTSIFAFYITRFSYRIDHILGFFRMWEIPLEHATGIFGKFNPALPLTQHELDFHGLWDIDRLTKPYITEDIVKRLFGVDWQYVREKYLQDSGNGCLTMRSEYATEKAIAKLEKEYNYPERPADRQLIRGLYTLVTNVCLLRADDDPARHFVPRIQMYKTPSFEALPQWMKEKLNHLYHEYFSVRQEDIWARTATERLLPLMGASDMLVCGEDLGMVPQCVPAVMNDMQVACLRVQRMTPYDDKQFYHPSEYEYLTVCTPSTHDMSTMRGWWTENRHDTQVFFNTIMGRPGLAPTELTPDLARVVFDMHLYSPAMLCMFAIQDVFALRASLATRDPCEERINMPSVYEYYWRYRIHVPLEELLANTEFNDELRRMIAGSGRTKQ
eukprot:TRINITY_DN4693_c0_g1_i1.p1 TRINITY_DN4693_c0_g1~~TRINITY_DN4693_c0_g1_i1.p1  ORF type:complete len:400 (-),score=95.05 TRINITY_DN4693_c0_g1_i1:72-1271(-)